MSSGKCKLKQDTTEYLLEWPKSGTLKTANGNEDVEQQELSFVAGGNAKWCSHFARQFDSFLQRYTYSYYMIQQLHSLVFTQVNWKLMSTQKPAHRRLQQLYS